MRYDRLPRSERIEDRRSEGLKRFGRAGGLGLGTIAILALLGWAVGVNPLYLIGGAEFLSRLGGSTQTSQQQATPTQDQSSEFVSAVVGSTESHWKDIFAAAGKTYSPPSLVMFTGATQSACGLAQAAMGPFYCPLDRKVYLDTSFFQDIERRFRGCDAGSKSCDFARAYVIAHEIGHHVQNQLGVLPRLQAAQQADPAAANQLQVRAELQADCFAGVWAHHAETKWRLLEPGDIEAAMQTASAIGDDRLQRRTQGYVAPDTFTHGSSDQRVRWFTLGLKTGQVSSCDTFQSQ
jgi:hypothetical protein